MQLGLAKGLFCQHCSMEAKDDVQIQWIFGCMYKLDVKHEDI